MLSELGGLTLDSADFENIFDAHLKDETMKLEKDGEVHDGAPNFGV